MRASSPCQFATVRLLVREPTRRRRPSSRHRTPHIAAPACVGDAQRCSSGRPDRAKRHTTIGQPSRIVETPSSQACGQRRVPCAARCLTSAHHLATIARSGAHPCAASAHVPRTFMRAVGRCRVRRRFQSGISIPFSSRF
ncbi:hypothetical protein F511_44568 [Dorcoceras hygrometricum]|uniref:Uncharacterized protein n=1 Tax=Dorcoceras hygrometricum TaxID=472368 RepID=A0A2Z7CMB2_9LAMI|nr:hypothetical protein F511_44568 [Dorcoceras hygrometricum]